MFETIRLFGITIHRTTLSAATREVLSWCYAKSSDHCQYVVTPNVDHVVMYQHRKDLRNSYRDASLVLADGAPVVWASRLLGKPLPERVAGSDLVPALFDAMDANHKASEPSPPVKVFLLGAAPGVAAQAGRNIVQRWQGVEIAGSYSPPLGFENDADENERILQKIAAASPDLLIVGLGAPKQELWVQAHHRQISAKAALCVGATIDFLAGHRQRSPVWMQKTGLEWVHRILTEPRRLASRYARDAWVFPQLMWQEFRGLDKERA